MRPQWSNWPGKEPHQKRSSFQKHNERDEIKFSFNLSTKRDILEDCIAAHLNWLLMVFEEQ